MTIIELIEAKLSAFWHKHVQKTLGALITLLSGADLLSWFAGMESDVTDLLGHHAYSAIHAVIGLLIFWRARQASNPSQPAAPPPPPLP
jgi:hypothetical protein